MDDLPLIGAQLDQLEVCQQLDAHFADHGHWQGISGGKVALGWLLYIVSEGDHRLSHVEEWAALRLHCLGAILEESDLRRLDFSDDRLGRLLDRYSDDEAWQGFEQSLGQTLLEVYDLDGGQQEGQAEMKVIRSDSFNAPQYRQTSELFTYGYSKQRRADQPFCKVMMASLDPLSVPIAVEIVKGGGTDADHYLSVINRAQSMFKRSGNLYVGDSQLGSMPNRLAIHKSDDYYLSPLNRKQCSTEQLHCYLDQLPHSVTDLEGVFTESDSKRKPAYYYEIKEKIKVDDSVFEWEERRVLVYSPAYAKDLIRSFNNRLDEAQQAIHNLVIHKKGRRNPKTLKDLYGRVDSLIKKYKVQECFTINCDQTIETYKVRKHKERPDEMRETITLGLSIERNQEVIELGRKRLGWQIYATNAPVEKMTSRDVVVCYRNEYRIEHLFDYIINRDVGLLPIFLKKENRVKGLIRLLSLAIRFSALIQYQVRKQLAKTKSQLKGIYPGNKNRATARPTTPMMLRAFRGLSIVWMDVGSQKIIQMTDLNVVQGNILELLKATNIYQRVIDFLKVHPNLRET